MGTLYIVSTPIGNLGDITVRALETLSISDVIASEDTRRTAGLITELARRYPAYLESGRNRRLIRYDDRTELSAAAEIIGLLENGHSVCLVSDAGTPLISDPGYVLVREARKRGIPAVAVPGPSAATAAVSVSGLPSDAYVFLGYPPEKHGHRVRMFEEIRKKDTGRTVILYAAPHKLTRILTDMLGVLGDTEIVILRELTKLHEEYWRGTVSRAVDHFIDPRGEFVILIPVEPE